MLRSYPYVSSNNSQDGSITIYGDAKRENGLKIVHEKNMIEMSKAFSKASGNPHSQEFVNAYLKEVAVITFFVDCDLVLVGERDFTHKFFLTPYIVENVFDAKKNAARQK